MTLQSEISGISPRRTQSGNITGYIVEVRHHGLNEIRTIADREEDTAIRKAQAVGARWDEKWARTQRQRFIQNEKTASKHQAQKRTEVAEEELAEAASILTDAVGTSGHLRWVDFEDHRVFEFDHMDQYPSLRFGQNGKPVAVRPVETPREPKTTDPQFKCVLTWWDAVWIPSRRRKAEMATARFDEAHQKWRSQRDLADAARMRAERDLSAAIARFDTEESEFLAKQAAGNEKIAALKHQYESKQPRAVAHYCELALSGSKYPAFIDPEYRVTYNAVNATAVVECELPDKDAIPTLAKVTYVASSNDFKEKHTSEAERDRLFDSVLYQVALRTIYELFQADAANALDTVVFNGWVNALNPATGKRVHGCLLSVQARKREFAAIDLSKVDPRACFKQLKGVSASRLSGMTPVRPILQLQTDDPRFIEGHEVASQLDEGYNLASMPWEEFEHLVRQLFEDEFRRGETEVHVTRASSDGGVDAVILDPDPLHGGKIVIQAKRYTNTVGLSAVRDLYGTVINEGANRGILVSTADYGPDAYEFIKGKPLTLLSGSNLLHLLAAHGHRARIDLKEAKLVNKAARHS